MKNVNKLALSLLLGAFVVSTPTFGYFKNNNNHNNNNNNNNNNNCPPNDFAACKRAISGSYFAFVQTGDDNASRSLITFTPAGVILTTDSDQDGDHSFGLGSGFLPFSDSTGVVTSCEIVGREAHVTGYTLNFTSPELVEQPGLTPVLPPSTTNPAGGMARLDYDVTVSLNNGRLDGTLGLAFISLSASLAQAKNAPVAVSGIAITADRLS